MRILWALTPDRGNWYSVAPIIAGLNAAGHDVVACGLPGAAGAATILGVRFVSEDLARLDPTLHTGHVWFDERLETRVRLAALTVATLRPLLRSGAFDLVLADPFRYGAGLAAETEGVAWVSYLHHCYLGDPVVDGLFQMSWNECGGDGDALDAYRRWWARLRARVGVGKERRPASDAWRYAISERCTLVFGPRALVGRHLPPGGVAIGATPWDRPGSVPPALRRALGRRGLGKGPVVLAAAPSRVAGFPIAVIADAARSVGATLVVTADEPSQLPALPDGVLVCGHVPHTKIISLVDAVVCGGGWGTTTKALAAGIPVVVIPHGLDTANTAAVVEATGAGVAADQDRVDSIVTALGQVLCDPTVARNARAIAETDAPNAAAAIATQAILNSTTTTQPPPSYAVSPPAC